MRTHGSGQRLGPYPANGVPPRPAPSPRPAAGGLFTSPHDAVPTGSDRAGTVVGVRAVHCGGWRRACSVRTAPLSPAGWPALPADRGPSFRSLCFLSAPCPFGLT